MDFLLKKGASSIAIEVKSSRRSSAESLKGLRAIAALKGLERRLLVYLGPQELQTEDGIEILPVSRFFEALQRGALW